MFNQNTGLSFVTRVEQAGITFDVWYNHDDSEFETHYHNHTYHDKDQEELIFSVIACESGPEAAAPWN